MWVRINIDQRITSQMLLWIASLSVKVPMVPIHVWLPEAHVEAAAAVYAPLCIYICSDSNIILQWDESKAVSTSQSWLVNTFVEI